MWRGLKDKENEVENDFKMFVQFILIEIQVKCVVSVPQRQIKQMFKASQDTPKSEQCYDIATEPWIIAYLLYLQTRTKKLTSEAYCWLYLWG